MPTSPNRHARLAVAVACGTVAGLFTLAIWFRHPQLAGRDFTWPWRGAVELLAGHNPYETIRPTGPYPFNWTFWYPLPGAIVTVPVAWMPVGVATAVMAGAGVAVLTFALTRDGYHRLPLLLSGPVLSCLANGQPFPLLIGAAYLIPAWQLIATAKPTIGLAVFLARPSWWGVVGGLVLFLLSFALIPSWLWGWLASTRTEPGAHPLPITVAGGFLVVLALLRWRDPHARLLLAMSLVPQTLTWYDPMPVMLVARTFRESLVLALITQIGLVGGVWYEQRLPYDSVLVLTKTAWFGIVFLYLPALVMVLRRPGLPPVSTRASPVSPPLP